MGRGVEIGARMANGLSSPCDFYALETLPFFSNYHRHKIFEIPHQLQPLNDEHASQLPSLSVVYNRLVANVVYSCKEQGYGPSSSYLPALDVSCEMKSG